MSRQERRPRTYLYIDRDQAVAQNMDAIRKMVRPDNVVGHPALTGGQNLRGLRPGATLPGHDLRQQVHEECW